MEGLIVINFPRNALIGFCRHGAMVLTRMLEAKQGKNKDTWDTSLIFNQTSSSSRPLNHTPPHSGVQPTSTNRVVWGYAERARPGFDRRSAVAEESFNSFELFCRLRWR
jgi:hypothetical protein